MEGPMACVRMQLFPNNVVPFGMEAASGKRVDRLLEEGLSVACEDDGVEASTRRMRRGKRTPRSLDRTWSRYWRTGGN